METAMNTEVEIEFVQRNGAWFVRITNDEESETLPEAYATELEAMAGIFRRLSALADMLELSATEH